MKKVLLTAALVLVASSAFAALTGSLHDLSSTGTNPSRGTSDQLCKYCHVPHNSRINQALWARSNGAQPGAFYTNPGSIAHTPPTSITATQSAACLSCHNSTPGPGYDTSTNVAAIVTAKNIINQSTGGKYLGDDHPISFAYTGALVTANTALHGGITGLQVPVGNTVNNGAGNALPLFTTQLECATCHAVHGMGVASFLRTTAAGSKICLKCHIK